MQKIRSSCWLDMGAAPGAQLSDDIPHGLRSKCAVNFLADIGVPLDEFIDSLDST